MRKKHASIFFVLLCAGLFIQSHDLCAQEARLTNIVVTNANNELQIDLKVEGAFTSKMKKAILSGVPASFSFFISLYKTRKYWFNEEIREIEITHTVKYHTMKKEFVVRRSWEKDKPHTVRSFKEVRRLMSQIGNLKVVPVKALKKENRYQIRAKAELSKVTLPYYLHYILFFVSLWDFETDWYTIDFTF